MLRSGLIIISLVALLYNASAQNANSGQYPAHVAVYMPANRFGEGVIVNRNHVLTVASNVFNTGAAAGERLSPNNITVRAGAINIGTNPPAMLVVSRIYAHEQYNRFTLENNIAVLRMALDFLFTPDSVLPFIAAATLYPRIFPEEYTCDLVGWFALPNNVNLQVTPLPVMARRNCNGMDNPLIRGMVSDQHMCVGTAAITPAICNNNPGAGYYCEGRQLVGLLSSGRQCNMLNSPGIIIQPRWYLPWIEAQFAREDNPGPGPVSPPVQ